MLNNEWHFGFWMGYFVVGGIGVVCSLMNVDFSGDWSRVYVWIGLVF